MKRLGLLVVLGVMSGGVCPCARGSRLLRVVLRVVCVSIIARVRGAVRGLACVAGGGFGVVGILMRPRVIFVVMPLFVPGRGGKAGKSEAHNDCGDEGKGFHGSWS